MSDTLLSIAGVSIPVGAARGVSHALKPTGGANLRRTVNGSLVALTRTQFRKYSYEVSCSDQATLAIAGLWLGQTVSVNCGQALHQTVSGSTATLQRTPVAGSVVAYSASGAVVESSVDGAVVTAAGAAYLTYRPQLSMKIVDMSSSFDEWQATWSWSISLEEV